MIRSFFRLSLLELILATIAGAYWLYLNVTPDLKVLPGGTTLVSRGFPFSCHFAYIKKDAILHSSLFWEPLLLNIGVVGGTIFFVLFIRHLIKRRCAVGTSN